MAGRLTGFLREYVFGFSIVILIVGLCMFIIGVLGAFFPSVIEDNESLSFLEETIPWSPYMIIVGFFVSIIGVYYLYSYTKNKKFVLEEIQTNKRSEFLKKHNELKDSVRYLPSKYKKLLEDKEKELRIR